MTAFITAADLDIDTATDQGLFFWFLASLLFGRPVPQETAAGAFRKFREDGSVARLVRTASTRDELSQRLQHF